MKPKQLIPALSLLAFFSISILFSCCTPDAGIHSATDGGNMKQVGNSANNDDTTSTPNVMADTAKTNQRN